jgi:hypothetical protein
MTETPHPKAMHWLGDRENADETRHAVDTTGCVLYFDNQGDCLEFMNSVLSSLPRPQPQHSASEGRRRDRAAAARHAVP